MEASICNMDSFFVLFYCQIFHGMDRKDFIYHSSVDVHLSCLHFLVIRNDITMNAHVWVFVWTYVFTSWALYLGVELLGHIVFLSFWGTVRLFSIVAAPFYIPTSNVWGFQLLHILANIIIFCVSDYSQCEVVSISVVLIWISLMATFSRAYWTFVYFLWKISIQIFSPFFNWVIRFFNYRVVIIFIYSFYILDTVSYQIYDL